VQVEHNKGSPVMPLASMNHNRVGACWSSKRNKPKEAMNIIKHVNFSMTCYVSKNLFWLSKT